MLIIEIQGAEFVRAHSIDSPVVFCLGAEAARVGRFYP